MKIKKLLFASILAGAVNPCFAKDIDQDFQTWASFMVQGPLKSRLRGYLEIQPRLGSNTTNVDRLIVRPALNYRLADGLTAWVGYAWQPLFEPRYLNENRIWQQVQYEHDFGWFKGVNRIRIEERFLQNTDDPSIRLRYMARAPLPLDEQRRHFAVIQNEVFANINTVPQGNKAGFDQDRLYVAYQHKFSDAFALESGYMANYINRPAASEDRYNHIWLTNIYFFWQ